MSDTELELKIAKLKLSQYKSIIELYMDLVETMEMVKDYQNYPDYKNLKKVIDFALFDSGLKGA